MAAIIFDLDGTIANSFDYIAEFLAREAGVAELTDSQKQHLRGMSMPAMARRLGHPWWRLPSLFIYGRRRMRQAMVHVNPFAGMPDLIRKLHSEGHELFIVSSNSVRNIHQFLHHHNLHTYFLEVYGGISLFGKAPALRQLLRDQQLDKANAIYVGDEVRDIQAAHAIGLPVAAVAWGFARHVDLHSKQPEAYAKTPEELMAILEEL